jgi:hypothetical protein
VGVLSAPDTRRNEEHGQSPKTNPQQFKSSRRIRHIFLLGLMGCLNHNNSNNNNNRARMEASPSSTRNSKSVSLCLHIEGSPFASILLKADLSRQTTTDRPHLHFPVLRCIALITNSQPYRYLLTQPTSFPHRSALLLSVLLLSGLL